MAAVKFLFCRVHKVLPALLVMLAFFLSCPALYAGEDALVSATDTPEALFYSGKYEEALKRLDGDSSVDSMALKAQILDEIGKYDDALAVADKALEKKSDNAVLLNARAQVLGSLGRYKEMYAALTKAVANMELAPKPGEMAARASLVRLYDQLARRIQMQDAGDWFFDYYADVDNEKLSPSQALWIGVGAMAWGDFENGIKVAALAQKKDENYLLAFIVVGETFAEKYQYGDAKREFESALKLNPKSPRANVGMAGVLAEARDLKASEEYAKKALVTNPRYVPAFLMLAMLEYIDEHVDKALELCDRALQVNPNHPDALQMKASLAFADGKKNVYEKSASALRKVYASLPHSDMDLQEDAAARGEARLLVSVAQILSAEHRIEEALPLLKKAVELDPENATAQTDLGVCLMRHGLEEEADPVLAEAFELDPFNVWVYNLRKLIKRDKLYKKFTTPRFEFKLYEKDAPVVGPYMSRLVDRQLEHCEQLYGAKVKRTVRLTMLKSHSDFSARVTGLPRLDASGATFGPFVALVSPEAMKRSIGLDSWRSVMLHEIAHVVTLTGSKYRIPRWLTEGMSVSAETWTTPDWDAPFRTMVRKGPLPDLRTWNRDFNRPEVMWRIPAAYMAAGLFVDWFRDEYGADSLPKLVALYGEGKGTEEVFKTVTGKDVEYLNKWFADKLTKYAENVRPFMLGDPAKYKEAEETLKKNPDDVDSILAVLSVYRMAGLPKGKTPKDANAMLDVLRNNPKVSKPVKAEAFAMAGELLLRYKEKDKASELFKLATDYDEKNAIAHFYCGVFALEGGDEKAAESSFRKAIQYYPRFAQGGPFGNPYTALADLLEKRGDDSGALQIYERYWQVRRNDAPALRRMAALYRKSGDNKKAAATYEKLMGVDPYGEEDHRLYAKILKELGKNDLAARELQVAAACPKPKKKPNKPKSVKNMNGNSPSSGNNGKSGKKKQDTGNKAGEIEKDLKKFLEGL